MVISNKDSVYQEKKFNQKAKRTAVLQPFSKKNRCDCSGISEANLTTEIVSGNGKVKETGWYSMKIE